MWNKQGFRRFLIWVVALAVCAASSLVPAAAQRQTNLDKTALPAEKLAALLDTDSGARVAEPLVSPEGYVRTLSQTYNRDIAQSAWELRAGRATLPSQYDLREQGLVTGVKFQNPWGNCWAFSTLSALEGNVLLQYQNAGRTLPAADYSERHLSWFAYTPENGEGSYAVGTNPMDLGGFAGRSVSVLSRWIGAADESVAPYLGHTAADRDRDWSVSETRRYTSAVHLQNAEYLPSPAQVSWTTGANGTSQGTFLGYDLAAITEVKQAILEHGVVEVGFYADQSIPDAQGNGEYIQNNTFAHYTSKPLIANHAVSIVGWDDDYSRTNFIAGKQPPADGAWIVKNNWDTDWGLDGYFYLSYYDLSACDFVSYVADIPDADGAFDYDNNYYYDSLGMSSVLQLYPWITPEDSDLVMRVANKFTAAGNERLKAVSITTDLPASAAAITIYRVSGSGDSAIWEYLTSQVVSFDYAGYHTVELETPQVFAAGEQFVVEQAIFSTYEGQSVYTTPIEIGGNYADSSGYNQKAVLQPNQSYLVFSDGWVDMSEDGIDAFLLGEDSGLQLGNVMIKAFTEDVRSLPAGQFGDVTGDGYISNKDYSRLKSYLADDRVELVLDAADVVADGYINNKDLARLKAYLADDTVPLG